MSWTNNISLLVGVPTYSGQLHVECALSIMRLRDRLKELGISQNFQFVVNRSLVTKARNEIANSFFFDTQFTHLLQIDSDLSFDENAVLRLLAAGVDFAGLPYSFKTLEQNAPVATRLDGAVLDSKTGLLEVKSCGTGLLLTKRDVFEKLSAAHPEWRYRLRESETPEFSERKGNRDFAFHFFREDIGEDGSMLSEDFYLCERWRALGGKVYLATFGKTNHHGQFAFPFDGRVLQNLK